MSQIWFIGNTDLWSGGGSSTPDPVMQGDATNTWDLEFVTSSSQSTYARTTLNTVIDLGAGTSSAVLFPTEHRMRTVPIPIIRSVAPPVMA